MKRCFALLLAFCCIPFSAQAEKGGWDALNAEAKRHLINLINIDTSLPEPDELSAARYIYKEFNKHGIDWDIFIPSQGRANLMARIKGTDASQKPLLLISHLDTAPAAEGWSYPPFKATVERGNIYGLGSTDAKNYTAAYLALFTWLKDQKTAPARDIIFLATSGEESGSETGLLWLGGAHWDKIAPGFALNEGGGVIKNQDGKDIVFAEASTKMYMDIKVTAYGTGVHSSMPVNDNAVYLLSQALAKIAAYNPPAKLTPTARTFFKAIAPLQDADGQTTIQFLLSGTPQNSQSAAEVMALDPFFRSQLKDTINPTVLSASKDTGSASGEASAILNVRLLPGSDPDEFFENLKNLFTEEDGVTLEMLERPQTPFPTPMDGTDPLFASIAAASEKLVPNAITVPGMSPASGDNEFLRKLGVITYGLGPDMDPLGENTAHSADEFISEKDFFHQLQFIAGVVFDFAYGRDLLPLTPQQPAEDAKETEKAQ
ncbi:M20/M25/M40 family metallo-hydrolase [Candidatus Avelusimicrobium alvi]|uniref:M20/M25/M40 family metallo-hydrolase n=1 Tax=Candidatus Avelusimicrobium alvi TaxID=3416221 RepID=UPI003D0DC686